MDKRKKNAAPPMDRPLPDHVADKLAAQAGVPADAVRAAWAKRERPPADILDPAKAETLTDAFASWMRASLGVNPEMSADSLARAAFIHGMRFALSQRRAAGGLWDAIRVTTYTDDDPRSVAYVAAMGARHTALARVLDKASRFDLVLFAVARTPDGGWEPRPFTRETSAEIAPLVASGDAKILSVNVDPDGDMQAVEVRVGVYDEDDCPCPKCTARREKDRRFLRAKAGSAAGGTLAGGMAVPAGLPPGTIIMPGPKNPV